MFSVIDPETASGTVVQDRLNRTLRLTLSLALSSCGLTLRTKVSVYFKDTGRNPLITLRDLCWGKGHKQSFLAAGLGSIGFITINY